MTELWPILILGFVAFVPSFGAHVVAVNLPVYAAQVGVGLAMIGVLIAAYDAAEVVAKPVFGATTAHPVMFLFSQKRYSLARLPSNSGSMIIDRACLYGWSI